MKCIWLLVSVIFLVSNIAHAILLKEEFTLKDIVTIPATRFDLVILLEEADADALCVLAEKNFENDYIKSAFTIPPEQVGFFTFNLNHFFDWNKNVESFRITNLTSHRVSSLKYVIKLKNSVEIIGSLDIYGPDEETHLGVFIDREKAHQRYGTEVIQTIIQFLKEKTLAKKVIWECYLDNIGSMGIAKNCDFTHERDFELYEGHMASRFYLPLQ